MNTNATTQRDRLGATATNRVIPTENASLVSASRAQLPDAFGEAELTRIFTSQSTTSSAVANVATYLREYAKDRLSRDLLNLVSDDRQLEACAQASYLHGNGFHKVVLAENALYKLRLHVWLPNADAEENLHEHRWHFASTVLVGTLHSEIYAEDATPNAEEFDEYLYLAKSRGAMSNHTFIGKARLARTATSVRNAGECYSMNPNTLHRIVQTSGDFTATLMCQGIPTRRSNRLLTRPHCVPDVAQRYLMPTAVAPVIRETVLRLSARVGGTK